MAGFGISEYGLALRRAAREGHCHLAECLLANGAKASEIAKDGSSALMNGIICHQTSVVKILIASGEFDGTYLEKALTAAVKQGVVEIVRILLKAGAPVRLASKEGFSAVEMAAATGNSEILDVLLCAIEQDQSLHLFARAIRLAVENGHQALAMRLRELYHAQDKVMGLGR